MAVDFSLKDKNDSHDCLHQVVAQPGGQFALELQVLLRYNAGDLVRMSLARIEQGNTARSGPINFTVPILNAERNVELWFA